MDYDANAYWGRQGLERTILQAVAATGKDVATLTIDDLALADQFHSGASVGPASPRRPGASGRPSSL